jgi:general nucleoside transport system ATP-binding protein
MNGTATAGESVPALKVCSASKRFGSVLANDSIDFQVAQGSIHALVGENGAGKTTLMRIVYGLYVPDSGHIELFGKPVYFASPREALGNGVGMVHQHSLLLNTLTVAENVLLSSRGLGRPPRRQTVAKLRDISEQNRLHVDPNLAVGKLSVGRRQRAEILNALFHGARLLILDEPTTVLTPQEAEDLFRVLHGLRDRGTTILLVTHKLNEVMAVTDSVTVLRAGKLVDTVATKSTDERALVRMMVGRDIPLHVTDSSKIAAPTSKPLLSVKGITVHDVDGAVRVRDVSFDVAPGEIVAVTGVEGNGQIELTEALIGLRPVSKGEIFLGDKGITSWSVGERRAAGMAYIPESRMTEGIDSFISVTDNLILGRHNQRPYARLGLRNMRHTRALARKLIEEFRVLAPSPDSEASTLSGGNLQRVVVAREVSHTPRLLIAAQPTQGVDVAAIHQIRSTLMALRSEGVAVVLISSDLTEVCDLADRTIVLYSGSVGGQLSRPNISEAAIGVYAMGLEG